MLQMILQKPLNYFVETKWSTTGNLVSNFNFMVVRLVSNLIDWSIDFDGSWLL